jgi:hypothetical protein
MSDDGLENLTLRYLRSIAESRLEVTVTRGFEVAAARLTGIEGRFIAIEDGWLRWRHGRATRVLPQLPTEAGVSRTCLRPRIPQQGKLMPDAGLIDDGCLDAGHSRSISETVKSQVFQMLHVACDNVHHQVVAPGDQER